MDIIASSVSRLIVGFGVTGQSIARFFEANGQAYSLINDRPLSLDDAVFVHCKETFVEAPTIERLRQYSEIFVSPGIDSTSGVFAEYRSLGGQIRSDVELFLEHYDGKIALITGTNGKSTVTDMLAFVLNSQGMSSQPCGNFGTPVLDLLLNGAPECAVIEISSFQLDLLDTVRSDVATILNVSPDHLDRYGDMRRYHQSKLKVYKGAKCAVVNADDPLTVPLNIAESKQIRFRSGAPDLNEWGLMNRDDEIWVCRGFTRYLKASDLKVVGHHNITNVATVLALVEMIGGEVESAAKAISNYHPLDHRCVEIARNGLVRFVNDSKATNVAATLAALSGLDSMPVFLLLGGLAKGGDFTPLAKRLESLNVVPLIFGEDSASIQATLDHPETVVVETMFQAIDEAMTRLNGESAMVLLSPACASMDQFDNYQHRGSEFERYVQQRLSEEHRTQ